MAAARCLKEHPEVYEKLRSGALTLCAVAELSKVMTPINKAELFEAMGFGQRQQQLTRARSQVMAPKNWLNIVGEMPAIHYEIVGIYHSKLHIAHGFSSYSVFHHKAISGNVVLGRIAGKALIQS